MDLKDIAAVSGKPGLFTILKPTRNGVILESIDDLKKKLIANAQSKISVLKEISIYTTTEEENIELEIIFKSIYEKFGNDLPVKRSSNEAEIRSFFKGVLPDYDEERVYLSDIKKVISWYVIILKNFPELIQKIGTEKDIKKDLTKDEAAKPVKSKPDSKATEK